MSCDAVLKLIPLYFYGEISPDEEDRLEMHLHECAVCSREMERQRGFAAALDERRVEVPSGLLEDCRADLMAAVQGGARLLRRQEKGPWQLFIEAMETTFGGAVRMRQPVGAVALVAIGFFAARFTGAVPGATAPVAGRSGAPMAEDVFATVRSVEPDSSGRVQIAFDETRRRVVSGSMADENIRRLLLAASHEDNTAVRVQSVDVLKTNTNSVEVRDALLNALAHDPNADVRLKALEGLKPLAGDPQVRKTLAQVLQADENPAVRMGAVDLLTAQPDDSMVGVFQNVVQKEENSAVRLKCEKALKELNASIGIF